jgi:hypothetical protein
MKRARPAILADAAPPLDAGPAPVADATGASAAASVALPRGHPAGPRDGLSISARTRAVVAALRPVVVRALSFWDHVARSVAIGSRRVEVDPSGSYRLL